jgi:hypothetical protein
LPVPFVSRIFPAVWCTNFKVSIWY